MNTALGTYMGTHNIVLHRITVEPLYYNGPWEQYFWPCMGISSKVTCIFNYDDEVVSSDGEEVVDLAVYEKRDGEHGVSFGLDGFGKGWTPVRRRRRKGTVIWQLEGG